MKNGLEMLLVHVYDTQLGRVKQQSEIRKGEKERKGGKLEENILLACFKGREYNLREETNIH